MFFTFHVIFTLFIPPVLEVTAIKENRTFLYSVSSIQKSFSQNFDQILHLEFPFKCKFLFRTVLERTFRLPN